MKLLIVEDDALIRKTVELKFKKEGYEVICCADGREGLQKIESELPDIVLTDIMLPYYSGLEIIKTVKAINKKTPVVVFSTMGQESMVEDAYKLGADEFVKKPFSLSELSIRIKRLTLLP
jgi:two-component system response regulator VicR